MPDLHNLAMVPGTPGYNARIPKPACFRCGEDHHPNVDYGHPWEAEPVHDEPVSASAIMRRPPSDVLAAEPPRLRLLQRLRSGWRSMSGVGTPTLSPSSQPRLGVNQDLQGPA